MTTYYDVGNIVNTHGIRGEVRVLSITDFPEERYKKKSSLRWEKEGSEPLELTVRSHRKHKNFNLLAFEEFPTINEVEPLVGGVLQVSEEQLTELGEDEFYLHEIIGLTVVDEAGEKIGHVKEILTPGANDVWVIQKTDNKELLLPYIDEVILNVDLEAEEITARIMEGLDDA